MKSRNFKSAILSLITLMCVLTFTGCTIPLDIFSYDNSDSSISNTAYKNTASSNEEIIDYIYECVKNGTSECDIFVTNEDLINANVWLNAIEGLEQLKCEYKRVKNGFNVKITYTCWDSFAIVKAYKTGNLNELNDRQLTLYNKYIEVLNAITSPSKSDIENELAVHDYLVKNVEYVDNGDSSFNAYSALIKGTAVCIGYTECFKTFMDMLGIENATISGTAGNESHIWNVVKLDNEWYQIDVTWDDPVGSSSDYIDHSYFNITAQDMALDHTYDKNRYKDYEECGTKYSYVKYAGITMVSNTAQLNRLIKNAVNQKLTHLEFASTFTANLKSAISKTDAQFSYSYKNIERNNYTLYSINFIY